MDKPVVGLAGMPHAAVHQGHGVAVFDDVDVDALDVVDPDGHGGQSDAVGLDLATQFWRRRRHRRSAHSCIRSRSVNQMVSSTSNTGPGVGEVAGDLGDLEASDPLERGVRAVYRLMDGCFESVGPDPAMLMDFRTAIVTSWSG